MCIKYIFQHVPYVPKLKFWSRIGSPWFRLRPNSARTNPTASRNLVNPLLLREPVSSPKYHKSKNCQTNDQSPPSLPLKGPTCPLGSIYIISKALWPLTPTGSSQGLCIPVVAPPVRRSRSRSPPPGMRFIQELNCTSGSHCQSGKPLPDCQSGKGQATSGQIVKVESRCQTIPFVGRGQATWGQIVDVLKSWGENWRRLSEAGSHKAGVQSSSRGLSPYGMASCAFGFYWTCAIYCRTNVRADALQSWCYH